MFSKEHLPFKWVLCIDGTNRALPDLSTFTFPITGDSCVVPTIEVLVHTLHWLAAWHAGGDKGAELDHLGKEYG